MLARFRMLLMASLLISPLALPAQGGQSPATVRVVLLDLTAVTGPGGAMGMMGAGPSGGWGPAAGFGNGYGMMGGGMMGGGMMGHGMMSIRVDHDSMKAGPIAFDVTNWSRSVVHEMIVVAVDSAGAPMPYDYGAWRVPEDQVKVAGETGELAPNATKTLELNLAPGTYELICNLPGHYAAGMVASFTVTP